MRRTIVLLALLAGVLLAPAQASAASGVKYGLTDDAWIANGPGTLESRLSTLDTLGVRIVRFTLNWDQIAQTKPAAPANPNDPAYDWKASSTVLDGLRAHGIEVILQLVGTPAWANGGRPPNYAPTSGTTFAAFATAAAREYRWVRRWLIWNEPNQARWLRPTSASLYTARLLNPAYTAIHRAVVGAQVAGGGTAPRGATNGVSPVAWIGGMKAAGARLDAYAQNPYPLDPKHETPFRGGCTRCATITMATIGRLAALVSRDFPRARIWLTEYGYQSNPPDRLLGVSLPLQARYIAEGAYAAYLAPRVDVLIHFLYRDEPDPARFQSGLVTLANARKPAFSAYQLPLVQTARAGTRTSLWGQLRAPGAGSTARIERQVRGAWRPVARVGRGAGGFFRWTGTLPKGSMVRVRAGALTGAPLAIT